jgi:hypothetical protein
MSHAQCRKIELADAGSVRKARRARTDGVVSGIFVEQHVEIFNATTIKQTGPAFAKMLRGVYLKQHVKLKFDIKMLSTRTDKEETPRWIGSACAQRRVLT